MDVMRTSELGSIDQLAADADRVAATHNRVPTSTYRFQFRAEFPLVKGTDALAYLHSLGVGWAYTSPILAARPGSTHGYDVIKHDLVNPEVGTDADFVAFSSALRERGMGLLLDTVPNHMGVGTDNTWWVDVLENGPASPYAEYFDIAWKGHPRERLHGKVLLPILGEPYGRALESGQFRPAFENGGFVLAFSGSTFPIDPRTYGVILTPALESAREKFGSETPEVLELQSILTAIRHLPSREEPDTGRQAEGRAEIVVMKRRLLELTAKHEGIAAVIAATVERIGGVPGDPPSFADLDCLLEAQAYRPCFWRVASDEINYRRFFDINDLGALSTEREEVFAAVHRKLFEWIGAGQADGLRIDHPDGLFDPRQYLDRLQSSARLAYARHLLVSKQESYPGLTWEQAEPMIRERFAARTDQSLYVVVEKILGPNEPLPPEWATAGTTGYEFLNEVNGLFVPRENEEAMTRVYRSFAGRDTPFEELVYRNKFLILQTSLASELHVLAHELDRLAQRERWSRDFTLNGLRHALREVIACFPVYRTYTNGGIREADRPVILRAIARARRRNPVLGRQIFDFIRDTLLLKDPPSGPASEAYRAAQKRFAGKFQQVTAPVTAKGLEDTAFYVFNRLTSLNEVGGEPARFGIPPAEVHAYFRDRAEKWPGGLSPLSTHDTKRGEDVRARINLLAEIPEEWGRRVTRWAACNRPHKLETEDVSAPEINEEYLLYQTLVGSWPVPGSADDDMPAFVARIQAYMNKATHEAKVNTSWINPNPEYDAAVAEFVARILDPEKSPEFLADLREFVGTITHLGMVNSLAQTLLRCTAPGVPDTYQGTELWDFSLVDPDNRRPVDYFVRAQILAELDERAKQDGRQLAREVLASKYDGRVKMLVTSRALRLRQELPKVFVGSYTPAGTSGEKAEHLFAFLREGGGKTVLVAVPRLVAKLLGNGSGPPVGPEVWGDTAVTLEGNQTGRAWKNVLTGEKLPAPDGSLAVAQLFSDLPLALLVAE